MTDPVEQAHLMERVHQAVFSGDHPPVAPREVVSDSWRRSLAGGVDPDAYLPPVVYEQGEVDEIRSGHPLAQVLPVLRSTLVGIADEAMHLMIVTDADGHILWREGQVDVRLLADRVRLSEGTRWSEDAIGTNAMGTALALGRPVQIHSAEHLVRAYHAWTCAAAPVHDPDSGAVLGAIDVTGPIWTRHPSTLALVTAAAQLAEGQLRLRMTTRDELLRQRNLPHLIALRGEPGALLTQTGRVLAAESCGPLPGRVDIGSEPTLVLPDGRSAVLEPLAEGYLLRLSGSARHAGRPRLVLRFLGATHPVIEVDGRARPVSLRHAEILTLLALSPSGLSAEQLAIGLHGEAGNPVTARAEVHRLRAQLGTTVVLTRPYRLAADLDADFLRVPDLLRGGELRAALVSSPGPLLPRSDAPAVRERREEVLASTRRAVLVAGSVDDLWQFATSASGADDLEVHERLVATLPRTDARLAIAATRLGRLLSG